MSKSISYIYKYLFIYMCNGEGHKFGLHVNKKPLASDTRLGLIIIRTIVIVIKEN